MDGATFFINPSSSSSSRYYALHHKQFGTSNTVPKAERATQYNSDVYDVSDSEDGTMIVIFNKNHGRNAYIEGISGRGDDNGWYTLGGGHAIWLLYNAATLYNGHSSRNYAGGWILVGHDDGGTNSW